MISTQEALKIVLDNSRSFGTENVPLAEAVGRVLAEDILSDRALPPFNRVCMDGIAIAHEAYAAEQRLFKVEAVGAAGSPQLTLQNTENCIEIMTGAVLPEGTDTVIRYEDLKQVGDAFEIQVEDVQAHKNIHYQGRDFGEGEVLLKQNLRIKAIDINILATVGKTQVKVKQMPRVAVISSGEELVEVGEQPAAHQIRRSNVYMLIARLREWGVESQAFHFQDDLSDITENLQKIVETHDVILMSGGVSKGKFDFIPAALEALQFKKQFHRVKQRPGKPFWFGTRAEKVVFAFPGNPVSTLACFHKYFLPWLEKSLNKKQAHLLKVRLSEAVHFKPALTYFAQAKLRFGQDGICYAKVGHGNGSGDIVNPSRMDGFIELSSDKESFEAGEVFDFLPFYPVFQ